MQRLFLQQSYIDCYEAYEKSLQKESFIKWDYVVLTASNEEQAETYREQIKYRILNKCLPEDTKYVVLSDPDGKRVGSGGATLNVLKYIATEENLEACVNPFCGQRILVIHSGGDSKRVPQYSACGKLFSPVPRELPDGRASTLFDEFIIGMSGVAGRLKEGMLVLSGDVLLLFNPLQIDFTFQGAAALSIKEKVSIGKNHGVFLNDGNDHVARFLHKQSEETLSQMGATNATGMVDLDTGAVALDAELLKDLYSLISSQGEFSKEKFDMFVNEKARISFYGDFLFPLASEATKEAYFMEAAEGEACEELMQCREEIWKVLSAHQMRLISLSPAEFIHFGTTLELQQLVTKEVEEYGFLGWKKRVLTNADSNKYAVYNSMIEKTTLIGEGAYIENSVIGSGVRVGLGSIISGVELKNRGGQEVIIPSEIVLHGLQLKDGSFVVRVYGVKDNPKDKCSECLSASMVNQLVEDVSLWEAKIYPICDSWEKAVEAALVTYRMMKGGASVEEKEWWKKQEKTSLQASFNQADTGAFLAWVHELEEEIRIRRFAEELRNQKQWSEAVLNLGKMGITDKQKEMLLRIADESDFSLKIRIYYALMQYEKDRGLDFDKYESLCFGTIGKEIDNSLVNNIGLVETKKIAKEEVKVELPVRVNWGGGWSDTPPHCMEQGGTVLNAAIKLNGIYPVQVVAKKLSEYKLEVASEDVGAYGEILTVEELRDCHNPYDSFALHKAALIACGLVPEEGGKLEEILEQLGGGIFLSTQVIGIPKGSGLGTSSILAGACVKAIFELLGENIAQDKIYDIVLNMEQIMSTGGGWQDQVGGIVPGIKFITSKPGARQILKVENIEVPKQAMEELQERFALIYTGQRRLARNLLRDVVGNYIGARPESLAALFRMQRLAALMRFELEKGNIDELAKLFNEHWELSKQLDAGSTNTCIEQIFMVCEDLIDGRFIAGAGGGGFLQVILKKGISKQQLKNRLKEVFQDSGVDAWDCEIC